MRRAARSKRSIAGAALVLLLVASRTAAYAGADPLPSWNPGQAKEAILKFVAEATRQGAPIFVPQTERIAVFDNDGTLWAEQPMYFQLAFALDRVKALAPHRRERKDKEPFKSLLAWASCITPTPSASGR